MAILALDGASVVDRLDLFNLQVRRLWLVVACCVCCWSIQPSYSAVYLNKWAVQIDGGQQVADEIASSYGFRNLGQIGSLDDFYLFEHRRVNKRSTNSARHHHVRLESEPHVLWLEQQKVKRRIKRDYRENRSQENMGNVSFSDPLWPRMWYLHRTGAPHMNVLGAWALGYTGKGIVVTILDDGIEHNHTDLIQNYDRKASYDVNDDDDDPTPKYDQADENKHGTRCAGEVAASANNRKCTVGVAYRSRIGGVRMLDGDVTDAVEAFALSLNSQHIDIYSASWGPEDNGKVVDGPDKLAMKAFVEGITKGRGGKGSIYVWASGNGGSQSDSCSCDGYASSIYTLSVSGTSEYGYKPWYLEECSSTLATTYSSGDNYRERRIITTDLHNRCTDSHTGTSASAPMAAGMCALALEANPDLTWRDMQYIVMLTARIQPLKDAHWIINGVGRKVSHRYGYGLMDAHAMVEMAERWTTVPDQHVCRSSYNDVRTAINSSNTLVIQSDGCRDTSSEINYLEHVQATVSLHFSHRGDLQIHLVSPNGTKSTLLPRRKNDFQAGDLKNWTFMSVFYWGEHPAGEWTLLIDNTGSTDNYGTLYGWQLSFYGTKTDPINLVDPHIRLTSESFLDTTFSVEGVTSSAEISEYPMTQKVELITNTTTPPHITKLITPPEKTTTTESTTMESTTTESTVSTRVKVPTLPTLVAVSNASSVIADGTSSASTTDSTTSQILTEFDAPLISAIVYISPSTTGSPEKTVASHPVVTSSDISTVAATEAVTPRLVCDVECTDEGCIGPDPRDCFACRHAKLLLSGECVSFCPNTTYRNISTGVCLSCVSPCMDCVAVDDDDVPECVTCDIGYFFYEEPNLNKSSCVEQCPPAYFPDVESGECLPCSPDCVDCTDETNCLRCHDNFELVSSHCSKRCGHSEYRDETNSCQPCHVSCGTCSGPSVDDCVACANDTLWENAVCVYNCSEGYFPEATSDAVAICEMCHPSCMNCFGPTDADCSSCYHPFKLEYTSCLEDCNDGFYETEEGGCSACHDTCLRCRGPNVSDCIECAEPSLFLEGQCVDDCGDGYFRLEFDLTTGIETRRCERCHATCHACTGVTLTECLNCRAGLLYSYGRCVVECDADEFRSNDQCLECSDACETCYGPLSDQCLQCHSELFLKDGLCLEHCPDGYYPSENRCHPCSHECETCFGFGEDSCLDCSPGYFMMDGICILEAEEENAICPERQYFNVTDSVCYSCDSTCLACNGSGPDQCVTCLPSLVFNLKSWTCHHCCSDLRIDGCCSCDPSLGICSEDEATIEPSMDSTIEPTIDITVDSPLDGTTGTPMDVFIDTEQVETATESTQMTISETPSISPVTSTSETSFEMIFPISPDDQSTDSPSDSSTSETKIDFIDLLEPTPPLDLSNSTLPTDDLLDFTLPLSHTPQPSDSILVTSLDSNSVDYDSRDQSSDDDIQPSIHSSDSWTSVGTSVIYENENAIDDGKTSESSAEYDLQRTLFHWISTTMPAWTPTTMTDASGPMAPHESSNIWSFWTLVVVILLGLVIFFAFLFLIAFCLLQAKASEKLCWTKHHYRPVPMPMWYQTQMKNNVIGKQDSELGSKHPLPTSV